MSESTGYEKIVCEFCLKKNAGYQRRPQYAQQGAWMDACEKCARIPYEQPLQFQTQEEQDAVSK